MRRERQQHTGSDASISQPIQATEQTLEPTAGRNLHAHHWMIEPPSGPTSVGQCNGCGDQKIFSNRPVFAAGEL